MKELAGKFAFVTGAANGIGLGIARALAKEGVHVALADIEREGIERAAREVAALGVRTLALPLDVSDPAAVEDAARQVESEFGRVHICVNNAGISLNRGPAYEIAPAQWDWLLGVNVFGAVNGVRAFLPLIKRHGEEGHIVNTASIAGLQVHPALRNGSYSMTKYAVVAFSEALEAELAGSKIGVSVLCPALVTTTINASSRRRPERFGGPFAERPRRRGGAGHRSNRVVAGRGRRPGGPCHPRVRILHLHPWGDARRAGTPPRADHGGVRRSRALPGATQAEDAMSDRPARPTIRFPMDERWLATLVEEAIEPERPIVDPHHHLWDRQSRYLFDELLKDINTGHNILATVYLQCGSMYRADGDPAYASVGETEFVNGVAAMSASGGYGKLRACAGIVGHADLQRWAPPVEPVLEAHLRAGGGRFRGIRNSSVWDADNHRHGADSRRPGAPGDARFREGFARLGPLGLSFDAWLYHPQIGELAALARAFPDTTIVLDHVGGADRHRCL